MPVTAYRTSSMDKVTRRRATSVKAAIYMHFQEAWYKITLERSIIDPKNEDKGVPLKLCLYEQFDTYVIKLFKMHVVQIIM